MKITLKKVEYSERMSEETPCFCADVYADGVKLGSARNSGHGGDTDLYGDFKVLHAYAKTLPPEHLECGGTFFDHKVTAGDLVEAQLYRWLHRKDLRRKLKKYTLFVKDGVLYHVQAPKKPLDMPGCDVLNTLPEEEALDLYINYGSQK